MSARDPLVAGVEVKRRRGPDAQPRRAWTDADCLQLCALVDSGLSRREVAAAAGRTEGSVRIQMRKLELQFCPVAARARAVAAMAVIRQTPEYRAKVGAAIRAGFTDEHRATLSNRCRDLKLWQRGQAVLASDPAAAERRAVKARENMRAYHHQALAWCPAEYRDAYRRAAVKLRSAAAARAHIEAQIAMDAERALAAEAAANGWSPAFVALLRRVRAGQVEVIERGPMRRAATVLPGGGCSLLGN